MVISAAAAPTPVLASTVVLGALSQCVHGFVFMAVWPTPLPITPGSQGCAEPS